MCASLHFESTLSSRPGKWGISNIVRFQMWTHQVSKETNRQQPVLSQWMHRDPRGVSRYVLLVSERPGSEDLASIPTVCRDPQSDETRGFGGTLGVRANGTIAVPLRRCGHFCFETRPKSRQKHASGTHAGSSLVDSPPNSAPQPHHQAKATQGDPHQGHEGRTKATCSPTCCTASDRERRGRGPQRQGTLLEDHLCVTRSTCCVCRCT